jgi:hypothetical protein
MRAFERRISRPSAFYLSGGNMADGVTIGSLPSETAVDGTETIPTVQGGINKKTTMTAIKTWLASFFLGTTAQAADSAKLGGALPAAYLGATAQAADSAELGGVAAASYALKAYVDTSVGESVANSGVMSANLAGTSRVLGGTYTNSSGRPMVVYVGGANAVNSFTTVTIDGNDVMYINGYGTDNGASFIVPNSSTYKLSTGSMTLSKWYEFA